MGTEPSNIKIVGVALLLFSSILLGVGIHHVVATGTCSSTGYSANYGPVPTCPSGTGWWFAFVFGGIIGGLAGALMAGSVGLVFAGIFGGIGVGALTIMFDSHTSSGTKVFGAVFGGCFAVVGAGALLAVLSSALGSLRGSSGGAGSGPTASGLTPPAPSAGGDPILSAYNASRAAPPRPAAPSAINLVPGLLQAAASKAAGTGTVEDLTKLAELHKQGAVTDAEFATAKAKLLGEM